MFTIKDSVSKVYRHITLECLARVKAEARNHKLIKIRSVPMPGSRDRFRVTIKADGHSWVHSSDLMAEFYCSLSADDRLTLSCLLEVTK